MGIDTQVWVHRHNNWLLCLWSANPATLVSKSCGSGQQILWENTSWNSSCNQTMQIHFHRIAERKKGELGCGVCVWSRGVCVKDGEDSRYSVCICQATSVCGDSYFESLSLVLRLWTSLWWKLVENLTDQLCLETNSEIQFCCRKRLQTQIVIETMLVALKKEYCSCWETESLMVGHLL